MLEELTVSLKCRCEMFEGLDAFVSNKKPQCVEMSINNVSQEHQFISHNEETWILLTVPIHKEKNYLSLKYKNVKDNMNYGNTRILGLKFYGCNIGLQIFNCKFISWPDQKTYQNMLYMGQPGEWIFEFNSPVAKNFRGICFG